jgi:hypothetical protein
MGLVGHVKLDLKIKKIILEFFIGFKVFKLYHIAFLLGGGKCYH